MHIIRCMSSKIQKELGVAKCFAINQSMLFGNLTGRGVVSSSSFTGSSFFVVFRGLVDVFRLLTEGLSSDTLRSLPPLRVKPTAVVLM
ncbi:hypothetical protein GEMRC1_011262 [Eukaryota sp. GEM-RC1]